MNTRIEFRYVPVFKKYVPDPKYYSDDPKKLEDMTIEELRGMATVDADPDPDDISLDEFDTAYVEIWINGELKDTVGRS